MAAAGVFDVVLGSEVAAELGYELGRKVVITHGMSARGIMDHDDKPFRVVGIMKRTSTPVDRSLYISLEGMEAVHIAWQSGAPPLPGEEVPAADIRKEDLEVKQITSFLLGAKARMLALRLQREVNTYGDEALLAVIPGSVLSQLWQTIGYAESALLLVSGIVVLVGLAGMLMALYTSLNERRREMAILRSLGAGPGRIVALFVLESGLLSFLGALLGLVLICVSLFIAQPIVEEQLGFYLPIGLPGLTEWLFVAAVVGLGILIGLVPAYRAYKNVLADGLAVRD